MVEFFNPTDSARNPIGSIGSRFIDLKLPIQASKLGRALSADLPSRRELESGLIENYRR
jgi:hypothetical protein